MKKYSIKDQGGFSETEKADPNSIPASDQENLPNLVGGGGGGGGSGGGGVGTYRNQNNYIN